MHKNSINAVVMSACVLHIMNRYDDIVNNAMVGVIKL